MKKLFILPALALAVACGGGKNSETTEQVDTTMVTLVTLQEEVINLHDEAVMPKMQGVFEKQALLSKLDSVDEALVAKAADVQQKLKAADQSMKGWMMAMGSDTEGMTDSEKKAHLEQLIAEGHRVDSLIDASMAQADSLLQSAGQ